MPKNKETTTKLKAYTKDILYEYLTIKEYSLKDLAKEIDVPVQSLRYHAKKFGFVFRRYSGQNIKDLTGVRFEKLLVLDRAPKPDSYICEFRKAFWRCKCDCGREIITNSQVLTRGEAKSCGCYNFVKSFTGFEEISGSYWTNLVNRARTNEKGFDITKKYIWDLFISQGRKCALSGLELVFTHNWKLMAYEQTASLDRIDSNMGYIIGNVQWVHKDINRMKWCLTDTEFITFCIKLSAFQTQKNLELQEYII